VADDGPERSGASEGDAVRLEELSHRGPVREYAVRIAAARVEERVAERLAALARSVRLPGFRAGKAPQRVLAQRYGAGARADAVQSLAGDVAPRALPEGAMVSAVDLVDGLESGDLSLRVTAIFLCDLPPVDGSSLTLERLVPEEADPQAQAAAAEHLKQQVLDRLAESYDFPVPPMLVQRELAAIWRTAEAQLAPGDAERGALRSELARIAERRVRLGLVVAETARRRAIGVSDEELARARAVLSDAERAAETPAQTSSRLLEEKVIAWIVSQARVRERRVAARDLR
jgi:FKBP-type peptidyl-prolyl cis-trans isomerase (trigger factor)